MRLEVVRPQCVGAGRSIVTHARRFISSLGKLSQLAAMQQTVLNQKIVVMLH